MKLFEQYLNVSYPYYTPTYSKFAICMCVLRTSYMHTEAKYLFGNDQYIIIQCRLETNILN